MEVLIVTGMSGAGKSLATSILEDIGFFCVDNLPKQMVKKLVEVANGSVNRIAIVIDVRGMKISGVFEELNCYNPAGYPGGTEVFVFLSPTGRLCY